MNSDVHKQIVCATESKQTRNKIEIELCDEDIEPGLPLVVIFTDRGMLHLSIQDIPGLIIALISLLVKRKFKRLSERAIK